MSRVDDQIRRELDRLTRPVRTDDVLARLGRRKGRRRVVRRLEATGLALAVLAGTATGLVGLNLAFGHHRTFFPGVGGSTSPGPTAEARICDESQLPADVDGDGTLDEVTVWSPDTTNPNSCAVAEVGQRYVIHVSGGKLADWVSPDIRFYGITQDLPECQQPFACRLFAAPDLNEDGTAELAVEVADDGSMKSLVFYRAEVDPAHDRYELVRLRVAAPGDPWNPSFGLEPGLAVFAWGDQADEVHALSCDTQAGKRVLVVTTSLPSDGMRGAHDVHQTVLRLEGNMFAVVDTNDQMNSEVEPRMPSDLCGAAIKTG
jgi:hypothetical protein